MVKIAPTTLTAILAILSHTAGAQSTTELNFAKIQKRVNAKTFVTRYRPVRHGRNTFIDLDLAADAAGFAACAGATTALNAIAGISEAFDSSADLLCDGDTCTIDNAPFAADYKDVCESNSGRIYTTNLEISCSAPAVGTFTVYDSNVPFCVGSFCEDDDVDLLLEEGFEAVEYVVLRRLPISAVIAELAELLGVTPDCELVSSSDADPYTCAVETFALSEIEEVSNAHEQYFSNIENSDDFVCDADTNTCTITWDYTPNDTDYNDACESNGGQIYTNDFIFSCSVEGDFYNVEYLNVLSCAGSSCSDDVFDELIEESLEEQDDDVEFDDDYWDGAECELVLVSSGVVSVAFAISTAIISTGLFLL